MRSARHIIKTDHVDGEPVSPVAWCGSNVGHEWAFVGAQHVLLYLVRGGSIEPCHSCLGAMMSVIAKEIEENSDE